VAFDIGQKGFPKVLVVQKLADTVAAYDEANNDGEDAKSTLAYAKNTLVNTSPADAVYQVVYLTDSPLGRTDFNDPKSRYPIPESRLFPFRHWNADPVDNSPQWDPREVVQADVLEGLFDMAYTGADGIPTPDTLATMAEDSGINSDVVRVAKNTAKTNRETLNEADNVAVDDSDMEAELSEPEEPPEPPEDGTPDNEQLGDFDPSEDL